MDSQTLPTLFHVRELILQLSYSTLVREGIIPDLDSCTPKIVTKRYPPWVYALQKSNYENMFCQFGLFVEEIVYWAIAESTEPDLSALWAKVCTIPEPTQLIQSRNFFGGIVSTFRSAFSGHGNIQHGPQFVYKAIQGHPDLVGPNWILDVKTTSGFTKMAHESFLQILAYAALAHISAIGILLPLQRQILWYDVSQWDSSAYLNILSRESKWVPHDLLATEPERIIMAAADKTSPVVLAPTVFGGIGCIVTSPFLGSHVRKESDYPTTIPFQIFLASPRAEGYVSTAELNEISRKCSPEHQLYVHAPYIINLCNMDSWPVERLRHELSACQQLGGKGVVVHVGKHKNLTYEQGLNMMEQRLRLALNAASGECPLLLETPAGEGTELCATLSSMMRFFGRFDGDPRLKLCVDTCHVFAAGYEPAYYMRNWLKKYPQSIGLVHFNDSKERRGSHLDRHYIVGLGYIGFLRLWDVHELCIKENIPMVQE